MTCQTCHTTWHGKKQGHVIKDNPQKNLITIIDIARAGKANKEMIDYIREKQIVRNALS